MAKLVNNLTDVTVRNAKPTNGSKYGQKFSDGGGLYLLVKENGAKYWRYKYRLHSREKTLALGAYPDVSLALARDLRDVAVAKVKQGIDPVDDRREKKLEAKRKQEEARQITRDTFKLLAKDWFDHWKVGKNEKHCGYVWRSLKTEVFPTFGGVPIREIRKTEVFDLVRSIEDSGRFELAKRVLQRISSVFDHAIFLERCEFNQADGVSKKLRSQKVRHNPHLTKKELPELLTKLEAYDGHIVTKLALQLVLLTFVRTNELRGAKWNEFDLDTGEWIIPEERMKKKYDQNVKPHWVPLSLQAVRIVKQLHEITGEGEYVFPNELNHRKTISENTMLYALYRMGYKSRLTVHGLRGTSTTILREVGGFYKDVVDAQLAHKEKDQVHAAYNHAEFLSKRREMMQWWSDFIDSQTGNNVIELSRRKV